jgi:hypothetical protein
MEAMGTYTEHWKQHRRRGLKGTLYALLWLIIGLPCTALVALGVERLTGDYPCYLHAGLIVLWLIAFTATILRYSKVTCPRCDTTFSQGKWVTRCPKCGLGIGQEDP